MSSPQKSGGKAGRRARGSVRIVLPASKPRNPVLRALLLPQAAQKAGQHRRSDKAERRALKVELNKETSLLD